MRLQRQQQRDIRHIKQQGITHKGMFYSLHTNHNVKILKMNFQKMYNLGRRTYSVVNAGNMAAMLRTY